MTLIQLHIPDDLSKNLNEATTNVESFVINAIRHELDRTQTASDVEIETSAIIDQTSEFLTPEELKYYLNLPSHV